jgi:hypothetical protein
LKACGTRADRADAQVLQTLDHAADCAKPFEIGLEFRRGRVTRCAAWSASRDAVLHQVVTGAHLAAEAVAARGDGHGVALVGRGLHQHGNLEAGETECVGDDAPLVAEVWQGDDDAVDLDPRAS